MPSSRLPLRRFWLAAAGSVAVGGAAMAFCATGILPASGQSQGNAAAIAQAGTTIGVYSGRHYNTDKEL